MSPRYVLLVAVLAAQPMIFAKAAQTHNVSQRNRSFSERAVTLMRGESIRFNNDDEFLHQVYVSAPTFNFMSAEQEPGTAVEIKFPASGTFTVRCEIHPKMSLAVTVQ